MENDHLKIVWLFGTWASNDNKTSFSEQFQPGFSLKETSYGHTIYMFSSLVPNDSNFYQNSEKSKDLLEKDFIPGSFVKIGIPTQKRNMVNVPAKSDVDLQDSKIHYF